MGVIGWVMDKRRVGDMGVMRWWWDSGKSRPSRYQVLLFIWVGVKRRVLPSKGGI